MERRRKRFTPQGIQNPSKAKGDRQLLILTIILTFLGVLAIADVSAPLALSSFGDGLFFAKQQAMWAIVGIVAMIVVSNIHYTFWKHLSPVIFGIGTLLLFLVLVPGVGSSFLGARRWIVVGPLNFQPSELIKFGLALFFAYLSDRNKPYWYFLGILGLLIGLIMLQPDLGTTIVVTTIGVTQLFVMGMPFIWFSGMLVGGGILGGLLILLSEYRRARLVTFIQSLIDPLGGTSEQAADAAYHIRQILIAIGSGGILGVGLGQSRQKYSFLPETATDSIFAIISEEIGFIGGIILISLIAYLVYRIIRIALRAPDNFSSLLVIGIAAWIGGQMFFNLGSMTALVPLTGIPLPFISYGGTSLTAILGAIGIVLNISKYAKDKNQN